MNRRLLLALVPALLLPPFRETWPRPDAAAGDGALPIQVAPPAPPGARGCESAELNLIFQREPSRGEDRQTGELFAGAVDEIFAGVPGGATGSTVLHVGIVSRLPTSRGVEGWAIQASLRGDLRITGATTDGTAAALAPDGLVSGGFVQVRVPSLRNEPGFYSAVVLSFVDAVTLAPRGTATVLSVTVEASAPQGREPLRGNLDWVDGCEDCAAPFVIGATVRGVRRHFCARRGVSITFLHEADFEVAPFRRCDTNGDRLFNLSDAIFTANQLFIREDPGTCTDAMDCDGDRKVNLSDVIYAVNYLFLGGPPPPPPFPGCGRTPGQTRESCPGGSTACPPI